MRTKFIGIDPGQSGGIAVLDVVDGVCTTITITKMPSTEKDVFDYFAELSPCNLFDSYAVIEKVGGYVGGGEGEKGGGRANGSTMFKFGKSYGGLRMALLGCNIPFRESAPISWQPAIGVRPIKGEPKTAHKNRLKSMAQQLFPAIKVTLSTADALLLAEFARRTKQSKSGLFD